MRHLVSTMLVAVAVIHLLPLSGVLGGERLNVLYGLSFDEPNLSILMRHRAGSLLSAPQLRRIMWYRSQSRR